MAKTDKGKSKGGKETSERASGKARKKNPKPNNYGANGKSVGGYSLKTVAGRHERRATARAATISANRAAAE